VAAQGDDQPAMTGRHRLTIPPDPRDRRQATERPEVSGGQPAPVRTTGRRNPARTRPASATGAGRGRGDAGVPPRRGRALAYPFVAAGALAATALAATALGLAAAPVAGFPVATPNQPFEDSIGVAGTPRIWGTPGGDPGATAPAQPPPPAAGPGTPADRAPAGQRPGTVVLPRGGTATLVRREVGSDGTLPIAAGVRESTWWGAGLDAPAGATVLAGHVNWHGTVGPFAELWQARAGQIVTVTDAAGRPYRYRISQVLTLSKDDLPARAAELFGQQGPHRLVLVTCGGEWVGGQLGYQDNRVVVAMPTG
jgi:hypothetical protein